MNFLQRIGNALSRFMYGRNGVDRLTLTMVWTALVLDIINIFLREIQIEKEGFTDALKSLISL